MTIEHMFPLEVDVEAIVHELRELGWRDYKIEIACGFSEGYVNKLISGARPNRPYQHVARLANFWIGQRDLANRQDAGATTT